MKQTSHLYTSRFRTFSAVIFDELAPSSNAAQDVHILMAMSSSLRRQFIEDNALKRAESRRYRDGRFVS